MFLTKHSGHTDKQNEANDSLISGVTRVRLNAAAVTKADPGPPRLPQPSPLPPDLTSGLARL